MTATTPPALPFTRQPGRIPPLGVQRWDPEYWVPYVIGVGGFLAVPEVRGILVNMRQRREVRMGLREQVDYCHRTITECVTALAAFHPDTRDVPWAKVRRTVLVCTLAWLCVHFLSNAETV
jgi:hypothetical protein